MVLDGSAAGAGANGLTITDGGGGSIIRGLSIVGFTATAGGGGGEGIFLTGTGSAGSNLIVDNYLGVEPDGSTAKANGNGILVFSPNNTIGGTTAADPQRDLGQPERRGPDRRRDGDRQRRPRQLHRHQRGGDDRGGQPVRRPGDGPEQHDRRDGRRGRQRDLRQRRPEWQHRRRHPVEGAAPGNLVEGNKIGTNAAGTSAIIPGNFNPALTYSNVYGIFFGTPPNGATTDNVVHETIGGTVAGAGNLISGNFIGITGTRRPRLIQGNTIGLNLAGTAPIPNGDGIFLGASQTTIGGTTALARNIISGNSTVTGAAGTGLQLQGDSDLIAGNFIGLTSAGLAATGIGNAVGMSLDVTNSTIGSTTAGDSNLISGNSGDAIDLSGTGGDAFYGNVIGLDLQGHAAGNGGSGIVITASSSTSPLPLNDSIGGTVAGQGNVIANGGGFGVNVAVNSPGGYTGLGIRGNAIFANALLGISTTTTNPTIPVPSTLFINGYTIINGVVNDHGRLLRRSGDDGLDRPLRQRRRPLPASARGRSTSAPSRRRPTLRDSPSSRRRSSPRRRLTRRSPRRLPARTATPPSSRPTSRRSRARRTADLQVKATASTTSVNVGGGVTARRDGHQQRAQHGERRGALRHAAFQPGQHQRRVEPGDRLDRR